MVERGWVVLGGGGGVGGVGVWVNVFDTKQVGQGVGLRKEGNAWEHINRTAHVVKSNTAVPTG